MALDVNKIIMESIQDNLDDDTPTDVVTEGAEGVAAEPAASAAPAEESGYNPIAAAVPPAISAGLGALQLRNKIRSVKQ